MINRLNPTYYQKYSWSRWIILPCWQPFNQRLSLVEVALKLATRLVIRTDNPRSSFRGLPILPLPQAREGSSPLENGLILNCGANIFSSLFSSSRDKGADYGRKIYDGNYEAAIAGASIRPTYIHSSRSLEE